MLDNHDGFGHAVTSLGDLDNDGVPDLAVGAQWDDDGGTDRGAVYILFLNTAGTVRATVEYLIPPADKARYYGASDYLAALPAERWRSTDMALELARGNAIDVAVLTGSLRRTHPVELDAVEGRVAGMDPGDVVPGGMGPADLVDDLVQRHWRSIHDRRV